jgi:hypothetical protein
MKYFVEFRTIHNSVNNGKAGTKAFEHLPEDTYFANGYNGTEKGQAFLFCFDGGTCLLPIKDQQGNIVINPKLKNK